MELNGKSKHKIIAECFDKSIFKSQRKLRRGHANEIEKMGLKIFYLPKRRNRWKEK